MDELSTAGAELSREQDRLLADEQFRLLVQGVTDYAIYMLDPDGNVASWNQGAQRIKGYAPGEIIGRHFSQFYTPEDRATGLPQTALETARSEGRFEKEGWRVRKDGTRFWANVVIDPIRGTDGRIVGFAKVTRDITERRDAQIALETAREQLLQSQKLEAIGQLTGGVAHDFNNLLMAILSSLELMKKRLPDDPRLLKLHDNAVQAANRGASLTQRMLSFARRQDLDRQPIDLPRLVHGMADLLQRTLGPRVAIETRFPLSLPSVLTDANQLETALVNLAVNARDAMPDGGTILVEAYEETVGEGARLRPGRYVCLSVTDHGEGMDTTTLARATEPFFTTKGVGKGTGLGLSMVHGLAEQSGGALVLRSAPDKGTTVEIWLPVADAAAEPFSDAEPPPQLAGARALTILAVDDDALVLMNTVAMLEDLGHRVLEAPNAREALVVLCQHAGIDLVITDHAMPGMTGGVLARTIRAEWPDLPVILATGYAELPDGSDIGLPRLAKPFLEADLVRAVAEATGGKPGQSRIVAEQA